MVDEPSEPCTATFAALDVPETSSFDPHRGISLCKSLVGQYQESLAFRLWKIAGKYSIKNDALVDIMGAIREVQDISEAKQLPRKIETIE